MSNRFNIVLLYHTDELSAAHVCQILKLFISFNLTHIKIGIYIFFNYTYIIYIIYIMYIMYIMYIYIYILKNN